MCQSTADSVGCLVDAREAIHVVGRPGSPGVRAILARLAPPGSSATHQVDNKYAASVPVRAYDRVDRVPEGASGAVLLALGSCRPRARRATAGGGVPGVDATDEKREDGVDVEVSGLPDDVIVDCFIIGKGSKEKVNKCEFAGTQRTAVPLEPLETAVATRGKSHRDRLPIHQP